MIVDQNTVERSMEIVIQGVPMNVFIDTVSRITV